MEEKQISQTQLCALLWAGLMAPAAELLLTMDVNLDGRVDAQDVRALADSFVQNTVLPTAQEDGQ